MNELLIKEISGSLNIRIDQVKAVLSLLSLGNTIPFIARYRKEMTGGLDEEEIKKIEEVYAYQVSLLKRKEDVIRLIKEKDLLTPSLEEEILKCSKLIEVEDLYRPFKEKKKTKASNAIALGLTPLAERLLSCPLNGTIESLATPFLSDKVKTVDDALTLAKYIVSEKVSDEAVYRKNLRRMIYYTGQLTSKLKKNSVDELETYAMYYDYKEPIKSIKPHRVLATNRGEKEGILTVNIEVNENDMLSYLYDNVITNKQTFVKSLLMDAIKDGYKRLIFPSIEREIRSELKDNGEITAIENFASNVESLLLTPPIKEKTVLGVDPAFRTGCKLAVLSKTGLPLSIDVIYPTAPHNKILESKKEVLSLIEKYEIDVIAIGNGTASREVEAFIADTIADSPRKVSYVIVSEAGASVYSASDLARKEFPLLTVEKRSAISIGRRLQDALAELVKIDPKSIGVGLYQHDVNAKKLDETLDFVVLKIVNQVGVNVNTASESLLKYVSGLTKVSRDAIIKYRDKKKIKNREELKKIKGISDNIYTQAIGFIRILDGDNILDKTSIHPESYEATYKLLNELGETKENIGTSTLIEKLKKIDTLEMSKLLEIDKYTLQDIIASLIKPIIDPRDNMPQPLLRSDLLHIEDLKKGDKLQGTVRNVVDFGLFIDIGLKNDGLAHISELTNKYLKHPSEMFKVGDIVSCYVKDFSVETKKVSLTLKSEQ